jgi:hypothetical protein
MNGDKLVVEAWMARRLGLPLSWDGGITTREDRREIIRAAILEKQCGGAIAGRRHGQPCETWNQLYQRVYGQSVNQQPKERTTCAE